MHILFFNASFRLSLCFLSIFFSCYGSNIKPDQSLRFAVISSTAGESPYSGVGPKLNSTITQINQDNPVFVVHLGNLVCGGAEWQGITKIDINRQYKETYAYMSRFLPILYTVKGDSDLFNGSSEYYLKYSGRKEYYSFNYGDLHFLVLDSTGGGQMSQEQKNWIRKDLRETVRSQAIFVFIHHPLFIPGRYKSLEPEIYKDYKTLHKYFVEFRVKAVFSGESRIFFKSDVDGISYINTGCAGFNRNDMFNGYCQYYIIDYKNGELRVQPKYVTYREKQ